MPPIRPSLVVLAASLSALALACGPEGFPETKPDGGGEDRSDGGSSEACAADAMLCPDGSSVGRDPNNDCAFFECPANVGCTEDAKVCPDGTTLARDPANDCQFPACPEPVACTADAKECPDGSYVSRDPENDCAFEPCPDECMNPETGKPDTVVNCFVDPCSVARCDAHPDATCSANYCGGCHALFTNAEGDPVTCESGCTDDAKECPDGTFVGRDALNACAFFPCP